MIYLASPYSHPVAEIMQARFEAVVRACGVLMKAGHVVYSPISHNHPLAIFCEMPTGWDFWKPFDCAFIERCDRFAILTLDGWKRSVGICDEEAFARALGRTIEHVDPLLPFLPLSL